MARMEEGKVSGMLRAFSERLAEIPDSNGGNGEDDKDFFVFYALMLPEDY